MCLSGAPTLKKSFHHEARRVEKRRAAVQVSDFRCIRRFGFVANGHQTISAFPPPPLKFRTAGFPQYGFKLDFNRDLHPTCRA
jgi:hypothetical protein